MTAAQSTRRTLRERAPMAALAATAIAGVLFGQPLYLGEQPAIRLGLTLLGVLAAAAAWLVASRAGRTARIERERNRMIVESTVEGIWLVDAGGRTEHVNARMAALVGCAAEEMVGRPVEDFLLTDGGRDLFTAETGTPHLHELRLRTKDGGTVEALATIGPVVGASGALAIVADNTEHKIAEQERAELASIVRATEDALIGVDLDGRITRWNPGAQRLYGYTAEEAIGRAITFLAPDDEPEVTAALWQRVRRGEPIVDFEFRRRAKDGRSFDASMTISPVRGRDGAVTGWSGILRDVTARKRLEEQLHHAQKMEAIGVLAGGVAHDFNNALMAIRGYSELMLSRLEHDDPLRTDAEAIQKAAEAAATVTRQLLAFSRRQVLEPRLLDVNEVVAGIEPMIRRLVGEGVAVRTVRGGQLGEVRADRSQLEQVLLNLAVNARDAMPTGGELTIETAEVELAGPDGLGESRRYVLLAVTDTGCGMTPEVKARAFEPFFTTKERGPSAGLGLATVYGIVEQSGGYVWAYSEPGQGATFKIYLPLVALAAEQRPGDEAPATALEGRESVLLVEDEDAVRNVVRQMLAVKGYSVLEARHGDEALAVAGAHEGEIDLVVTDVVMPRMSGPEFVQRLRELRPDVHVLFISGYTDDTVVHHGVLEEGVVFLQKPFAGAALARKVRQALDGPGAGLPLEVR